MRISAVGKSNRQTKLPALLMVIAALAWLLTVERPQQALNLCLSSVLLTADKLIWPIFLPGRLLLPYQCSCKPEIANISFGRESSPRILTMSVGRIRSVLPSGKPQIARKCNWNWQTSAPCWVQWPELCTRGAISFTKSCWLTSKNSIANTPT